MSAVGDVYSSERKYPAGDASSIGNLEGRTVLEINEERRATKKTDDIDRTIHSSISDVYSSERKYTPGSASQIGNLEGRTALESHEEKGTTKKTDDVSRAMHSSNSDTNFYYSRKPLPPIPPRPSMSSRESPPVVSKELRIQQLRAEYGALIAEHLHGSTESTYVIPERRACGTGTIDSAPDSHAFRSEKRFGFVTDEEIIKRHPMKFLPNSPLVELPTAEDMKFFTLYGIETLWSGLLTSTKKQIQAIAITESGKHVMLQQTGHSSVPTCMAMLLLDRGKKPNYKKVRSPHITSRENSIKWVKKFHQECQVTKIPQENVIEVLSMCLAEKGPGILLIHHPSLTFHGFILDEISIEKNEATIRDPFHGWMISIDLGALIKLLQPGDDFIQIV